MFIHLCISISDNSSCCSYDDAIIYYIIIGTIMDLPYVFKADGEQTEMTLDPDLNLDAFIQQITGQLMDMLKRFLP